METDDESQGGMTQLWEGVGGGWGSGGVRWGQVPLLTLPRRFPRDGMTQPRGSGGIESQGGKGQLVRVREGGVEVASVGMDALLT